MRERLYLSVLVGVLLCLAGWTAHAQLQRSSPAGRAYEYKSCDCRTDDDLNRLGAQGWEIATVQGIYIIFKRPK